MLVKATHDGRKTFESMNFLNDGTQIVTSDSLTEKGHDNINKAPKSIIPTKPISQNS